MCFSATASFVAAGVLGTIGVLSLRAAPSRSLRLLAAIPLIFAFQQTLEGIAWVTLNSGQTDTLLHDIGVYGFLLIAGIFWPVGYPAILYQLEQNLSRKRILLVNIGLGVFLAVICLFVLSTLGGKAEVVAQHISYRLPGGEFAAYMGPYGKMEYFILLGIYAYVIVGSSFVSTLRYLWIFGALTGGGLVVSEIFYAYALSSVWCYFAAIMSISLYFIIKCQHVTDMHLAKLHAEH